MWVAELEDGSFIAERDVEFWDNFPTDKRIKNIKFNIPILRLEWESGPAERYVVSRVGMSVMSGQQKMIGYCAYYQRDDVVFCLSIKYDGTQHRVVTEDLGIPDRAWRQGILSKKD